MSSWWSNRWVLRGSITAALLALVVSGLWWTQEDLRVWWYMGPAATHVPPFDPRKAANLTPERRSELERELFTELPMWNDQSRRYVEPHGRHQREQRWQEMADEGLELAHLVLWVLQPSKVRVHDPRPVFHRLEELAQQGDTGAMCLMVGLIRQANTEKFQWLQFHRQKTLWMERGAELGHPQCFIEWGTRLLRGGDGQPLNIERGKKMLIKAARSGWIHGVGILALYFEERNMFSPTVRRTVYCWEYHSSKYRSTPHDFRVSYFANFTAPIESREDLRTELAQLRLWHPTIENCIELSQGE